MKHEPPQCPHCDSTLKPERIDAGRYVCTCCARIFFVPKGLRRE
jgi:ribosomal protein L37AE/L43A